MRVHGIEKIDGGASQKGKAQTKPRYLMPAAIIAALAAIVGAYLLWRSSSPEAVEGEPPIRPLTSSELTGYMHARHVEVRDLIDLFDADEEIEAFAERATAGKTSPLDKARGVSSAIRARASKNAFVRWSITEPRDTTIRSAVRTYAVMKRDDAREHLYPLEVASVAIAALRAEGVDAMLVAIYAFPNDTNPPDPSGHFGYFGVAVYPEEAGQGTPTIVDPYGGRTAQPRAEDIRVLSDVEAVGLALNTRAMYRIVREGNAERAFDDSSAAMSLARNLPEVHSAHAAVLITSGGLEEAVREFQAAAQMRNDAPRRNNLASILMARQDTEGAAREAAAALERSPDYAPAHATLAALHLQAGENEEAQRELERAQSLDPDLANLSMLWAQYYMSEHEPDQAIAAGEEAVRRRPEDPQAHLVLATLYRAVSRFPDMRREAQLVVDKSPAPMRERVRAELISRLGATVFESPDEEPIDEEELADVEGELGPADPSSLRLGAGSRLLGDDDTAGLTPPAGPTDLESEEDSEGGALRLGDRSRLRLGGEGEGLRLQLNP